MSLWVREPHRLAGLAGDNEHAEATDAGYKNNDLTDMQRWRQGFRGITGTFTWFSDFSNLAATCFQMASSNEIL